MTALFRAQGNMLDYTPPSDVSAGTMVALNDLWGFAPNDISANVKGALAVAGIAKIDFNASVAVDLTSAGNEVGFDDNAQEAIAGTGLYSTGVIDTTEGTAWVFLNHPG